MRGRGFLAFLINEPLRYTSVMTASAHFTIFRTFSTFEFSLRSLSDGDLKSVTSGTFSITTDSFRCSSLSGGGKSAGFVVEVNPLTLVVISIRDFFTLLLSLLASAEQLALTWVERSLMEFSSLGMFSRSSWCLFAVRNCDLDSRRRHSRLSLVCSDVILLKCSALACTSSSIVGK